MASSSRSTGASCSQSYVNFHSMSDDLRFLKCRRDLCIDPVERLALTKEFSRSHRALTRLKESARVDFFTENGLARKWR
eukprot:12755198-Heterocapsa_arctica.AAC.1